MTKITRITGGFDISHTPCVLCGEPPFGGEYCCGHSQEPQRCAPYPDLDFLDRRRKELIWDIATDGGEA